MNSLLVLAQEENIYGGGDRGGEPQQRIDVRARLQLCGLGRDDEGSQPAVARDERDRDRGLGGGMLLFLGGLPEGFVEGRGFFFSRGPPGAALSPGDDAPPFLTRGAGGETDPRKCTPRK